MKDMRRAAIGAVLVAGLAGLLAAEEQKPERAEMSRTPQAPPSFQLLQIQLPPERPKAEPGAAAARELQTTRALAVNAGEARLTVDGRPVTLRAGDSLGTAVVKSIVPGRLVLERRSAGSEGDLLLVTFDAQGRPQVRAYTAAPPQRPSIVAPPR
jgi:hypothetical protein